MHSNRMTSNDSTQDSKTKELTGISAAKYKDFAARHLGAHVKIVQKTIVYFRFMKSSSIARLVRTSER
jgi:hypothetical protein